MPMCIQYNNAANMVLGEQKKNESKLAKDLKKAASGMKLNSAGDAASEYSISEKMRVQIRGLDQDIENVKNGKSLLAVADGGIQNILDELRSLKELAINSANDHNSDQDRATIQKEFDQRKTQIEDIAEDTNYNGIPLLNGMWCQKAWVMTTGAAKIISQHTDTTTTNDPATTTTVGPTSKLTTSPTVSKTTTSTTSSTSDTEPTNLGTTTVGPVTQPATKTSSTTTNGPSVISSKTTSKTASTSTKSGNQTTVVDTKQSTTTTTSATSTVKTDTTTVKTVTTTTIISAVKNTKTVKDKPILITNGMTSINKDGGVYQFASDFTGTLSIEASSVEIMGPEDGTVLQNVQLVDNGVDDLYLKNVSIENQDKTKSIIAFDASSTNTLHLLGTNTITETYVPKYDPWDNQREKAAINAGGGLSIVGNGSLSITREYTSVGALIGSDRGGTCGDISIGEGVTLNLVSNRRASGAGIGSGGDAASCGNIYIGSGSQINVTMNDDLSPDKYYADTKRLYSTATAIGAGSYGTNVSSKDNPPTCGDIYIYSNANVSAKAQGGAGIGCSKNSSICGDITIYSNAKVTAESIESAGIGSGDGGKYDTPITAGTRHQSKCGSIFIFSYSSGNVQASTKSPTAQAIGQGNTSASYSAYSYVQGVYLDDAETIQPGGIKDFSELSLGETTKDVWDVTTTTITKTDTTVSTLETTTTKYETTSSTTQATTTTVYEDGPEELQLVLKRPLIIHTGTKANQHLRIYIEDMRPEALGIDGVLVNTRDASLDALGKIDAAIEKALDNIEQVGAYSSRLSFTEDTLTANAENTRASESVIRDADMAKTMMDYARDSILSQSAQAMLAQANQNVSAVLSLLQ